MATSSISQCSGLVQGDCVELSDYGIHARFKGLIRGKHLDGVSAERLGVGLLLAFGVSVKLC